MFVNEVHEVHEVHEVNEVHEVHKVNEVHEINDTSLKKLDIPIRRRDESSLNIPLVSLYRVKVKFTFESR